MRSDVLVIPDETGLLAAGRSLHSRNTSAALVVDGGGITIGLVEADDLLRGLASGADHTATVNRIMQGPSALCPTDASLPQQIARMQHEGRRALGVIDRTGRPAG